jgi:electron transfer flavoprotein beta subunit
MYQTLEIDFPCLITVEKNNDSPRLPSYKRSVEYRNYQIEQITFDKLYDKDESKYGLKGSPTQVERMFNPDKDDSKVMLEENNKSFAEQLKDILKEKKYI